MAEEWQKQLEEGNLPPDFEINEALLKKIGVAPSKLQLVKKSLADNGCETWGLLRALETKDKAIQYCGNDELNGVAIWNYVQEYTTKAASARERAEYSQSGVPVPGEFMNFSEDLFKKGETVTRSLYVRECYASMFEEYEAFAQPGYSEKGRAGVAVIGTPGIGKSGFGLYCVARFASTRPVYFRHKASPPYLIVACPSAVNSVRSVFPEVDRTGVYEMLHETTRYNVSTIHGLVAVVDPLVNEVVLPADFFQLVVSSPDDQKLKEFLKSIVTVRRVMPKWTLEEVRAIVAVHSSDANRQDPVVLARLQALAIDQFEFFGGVPRSIFDPEKSRLKVHEQISVATATSLQRAFQIGDGVKGDLGEYLVHTVPLKGNPNGVAWELASLSIGKLLVKALIETSKDDFKTFFASTLRIPALQQLRGLAFEAAAHKVLANGGEFEIAELRPESKSSSTLRFRGILLPPLHQVECERRDMTDLTTLEENQLAIPMIGNFESVDAFAALRQGLLNGHETPKSTPLSSVGFKVTTSDLHNVKGLGLKRVRDKTQQRVGSSNLPISLVFVSESTGITKRQRIVNSSDGEYVDGFDQTVSQHFHEVSGQVASEAATVRRLRVEALDAREVPRNLPPGEDPDPAHDEIEHEEPVIAIKPKGQLRKERMY